MLHVFLLHVHKYVWSSLVSSVGTSGYAAFKIVRHGLVLDEGLTCTEILKQASEIILLHVVRLFYEL